MRQVHNGKIYDTDKSEVIETMCNDYHRSDFQYYFESLHLTPKGAYFLYGEGGPASHYAERVGNASIGGNGIKPLSDSDAFEWLQKGQFIEQLVKLFGHQLEEA